MSDVTAKMPRLPPRRRQALFAAALASAAPPALSAAKEGETLGRIQRRQEEAVAQK